MANNTTMSLLASAKATASRRQPRRGAYSREELDLVRGWLNGDVGMSQVAAVLGIAPSASYTFLAMGAKQLWAKTLNK